MIAPGIHDSMPAEEYHADPCPQPSLSSSIVRELVQRTPLHAAVRHPRLSKIADELAPSGDRLDIGSLAHRIFLEGEEGVVMEVDADDWRTRDAREARDEARALGRIALLSRQMAQVREMVAVLREQIATITVMPTRDSDCSMAEVTVIWREGNGVWCRARVDLLCRIDTGHVVYDFKTTGIAIPRWAERTYWDTRLDIQATWYLRGLRACGVKPKAFRYIVQETQPPYAAAVFEIMEQDLECAKRDVERSIDIWKRCLDTGVWPGYPPQINALGIPSWFAQKHELIHARRKFGGDEIQVAIDKLADELQRGEPT